MIPSSSRVAIVDTLRGLAALSVCWFHFTQTGDFLPEGVLKSSGAFGWLGVEMFFVISGFVIPYALHRSDYRLSHYGTFILKRLLRLDPPYLVSLLVVLALGYASAATPGFAGKPFKPSVAQVVLHLGYLNVFFGYEWLSPIYWTLAIEVQYYLLIGLVIPALVSRSCLVQGFTFVGLGSLALIILAPQFLFHWLFLFMLGMAACQLRIGLVGRRQFLLWVVLFWVGAWYVNGGPIAMTGMVTALVLGFFEASPPPPVLFLGSISYSLYLFHAPIGWRIIHLGTRFVDTTPGKIVVLAVALTVTITVSWLLYYYVERPAQQWSASIQYRKKLCLTSISSRISSSTRTWHSGETWRRNSVR